MIKSTDQEGDLKKKNYGFWVFEGLLRGPEKMTNKEHVEVIRIFQSEK